MAFYWFFYIYMLLFKIAKLWEQVVKFYSYF